MPNAPGDGKQWICKTAQGHSEGGDGGAPSVERDRGEKLGKQGETVATGSLELDRDVST